MGGKSVDRRKKRKFHGNRFSSFQQTDASVDVSKENAKTCCEKKVLNTHLEWNNTSNLQEEKLEHKGQHKSVKTLTKISKYKILIPFKDCLYLVEDSMLGLCSNFSLQCKNCSFTKGFASSKKPNTCNEINTRMVYALRVIGKGFSAGTKLCAFLNLPAFLSKRAFRMQGIKILRAATTVAENCMRKAAVLLTNSEKPGAVREPYVSFEGRWTCQVKSSRLQSSFCPSLGGKDEVFAGYIRARCCRKIFSVRKIDWSPSITL